MRCGVFCFSRCLLPRVVDPLTLPHLLYAAAGLNLLIGPHFVRCDSFETVGPSLTQLWVLASLPFRLLVASRVVVAVPFLLLLLLLAWLHSLNGSFLEESTEGGKVKTREDIKKIVGVNQIQIRTRKYSWVLLLSCLAAQKCLMHEKIYPRRKSNLQLIAIEPSAVL